MPGRIRAFAFVLSLIAWGGVLGTGLHVLWSYESGPGPSGQPPSRWPRASLIPGPDSRPALLLFAHPQCPCTRASLDELIALMTRTRGKADVYVLFSAPPDSPDGWERTATRDSAGSIPGVRRVLDTDGVEATRFGALTSGHVLLYGADGSLLFSGGITAARGHAGDNPGRAAIVTLLSGQRAARGQTPTFGCLLPIMTGQP
jgi:hypothetical protein